MKRFLPWWALVMWILPLSAQVPDEPAEPKAEQPQQAVVDETWIDAPRYEDRASQLLEYCATTTPKNPLNSKESAAVWLSRLILDRDAETARKQFRDSAVATYEAAKKSPENGHLLDPFFKHALMHIWLLCHERCQLLPETESALKGFVQLYRHKEWKGYGALNYRLMNDGAGFLAAEQWPDLVDADGLNADQIKEATGKRLLGYFNEIVHRNFHEYGAPTYGGVDFSAMKMIADFALDPTVKQHARLTLDWMLLNVACAWNQGYHTTPAGRAKYWISSITCPEEMDCAAGIGWLYYGGRRPVRPRGMSVHHSIFFACPRDYRAPDIFTEIANDRTRSFLHRGSFVNGGNELRISVYHTPAFSLASEWEFLRGPTEGHYKESRRQMLKWISNQGFSTFCPLQENPRRPYKLQEKVANAFGYGENPFGQSLQHEGTLVGIIAVPDDYPYWKLYAPFPLSGAIVKRVEKDGWVFCHAGSMLFAFRPLQPYTWGKPQQNFDVLWSDARKNGWILETSELKPFAGGDSADELARFITAVLKNTKLETKGLDTPTPRLVYTALDGHVLDLTYRPHGQAYTDQHKIDGQVVDYRAFPLLDNPWVHQAVDGDILTLQHGANSRVYDFKNWTVVDSKR